LGPGPFAAEHADTDYVCDRCGVILASVPNRIGFAGDKGPVIFACYACDTDNLAPQ
jgi:hypothetical protein